VIDISDPTAPEVTGTVEFQMPPTGVAVAGGYAYVSSYLSGLQVVDVSNPTSPTIVGSADTPVLALDVTVAGSHAYVADSRSGVQVIDIANPRAPLVVGGADTPDEALAVAWTEGMVLAADGTSGLQIVPVQCEASATVASAAAAPAPHSLLSAWPNPFRGTASLAFEVATHGTVELAVYDVAGRHVRTFARGVVQPGRHTTTWDGRNESGKLVTSGTYFVRLAGPGESVSQRLTVLR
jgi:hypothetical protein